MKASISSEMEIAINNAIKSQDKAVRDFSTNHLKAANDAIDAASAVARYGERKVRGVEDSLSDAEQRFRDGKVADAFWHLSTDSWQKEDKNAAQLAEENQLVATAMEGAASTYGGPAGAAAFAAWRTYHTSGGNVDLALKAGAYAYARSVGATSAGKMPSGTISEIAKKAAYTGAVSGLAVAAAGGTSEDALRAFVRSGGAIIVQSGQTYAKNTYSKHVQPKIDSYCTTLVGSNCAEAQGWYEEKRRRLDALKKNLSTQPSVVVTSDGNWAISFDKEAMKAPKEGVPAVSLTFVGDSSPFDHHISEIAAMGDPLKYTVAWAALGNPGDSIGFFKFFDAARNPKEIPIPGDHLVARSDVNMRATPSTDGEITGLLAAGSDLLLLEKKSVNVDGRDQIWLRFRRTAFSRLIDDPNEPTSLAGLIAAIKASGSPLEKKALKERARSFVAKDFNFGVLARDEIDGTVREVDKFSFISYESDKNRLVFKREFKSFYRASEREEWMNTASFNGTVAININQVDKLRVWHSGILDVDCNSGQGKCVSHHADFETCKAGYHDCISKLNWFIQFRGRRDDARFLKLQQAFITVLYKIDGRPSL